MISPSDMAYASVLICADACSISSGGPSVHSTRGAASAAWRPDNRDGSTAVRSRVGTDREAPGGRPWGGRQPPAQFGPGFALRSPINQSMVPEHTANLDVLGKHRTPS